jgi:hypothetical protein
MGIIYTISPLLSRRKMAGKCKREMGGIGYMAV